MTEEQKNRYYLEGMSLKEWLEASGAAKKAETRGLSCTVEVNPRHHIADFFERRTNNFVMCRVQWDEELTFVHSLDPVCFSVGMDSPVMLDGDLVVEGHRIRLHGIDTRAPD
jgi:hypothetical protein